MKEKLLIFQGDPCLMCLDDPTIQTVTDAQAHGQSWTPHDGSGTNGTSVAARSGHGDVGSNGGA